MHSNCFEIEHGVVDGSPLSRDILNVAIGTLIKQICSNEKVLSFTLYNSTYEIVPLKKGRFIS